MKKLMAARWIAAGFITAAVSLVPFVAAKAETELTLWSMGADDDQWVKWIETIQTRFEASHPGVKLKVSWYDLNALRTALNTALRAGQGPDIIYNEPDQKEFADSGYLMPLENVIDWSGVEPWARDAWSSQGHAWGVPIGVYTDEIYYNKDLLAKLGVTLPANGQFDQVGFMDLIAKAKAAGITPIATGTGDRDFPGSYLTFEGLLRKLGPDDYGKLLAGKLSYKDPRVIAVLTFTRQVADAGGFPKTFATMSLTDSYAYFFSKPGGLMFPQGTWYTGRAFKPAEKGGQPQGFNVGVMNFPAMDGGACNECKTLAIGGGYSINADTKQKDLAAAFMDTMATPEMGTLWVVNGYRQTGIKSDSSKMTGRYATYFKELADLNKNAKYFVGIPQELLKPDCKDAFVQVINVALPAGLISVDDAAKRMDDACYQK
jgi:multiple sugar transport system substrate-binding protein